MAVSAGRISKRAAMFAAALALVSCAPAKFETRDAWQLSGALTRALSIEPGLYRLAAGDRVRTTVFGQTNVTGEYLLDETGSITLPLGGSIRIKGLTADKAAKYIQERLLASGAFRDPRVTVELAAYAPIYVLGEVTRPGEVVYRPGMSLFSAVALTGGYTYRASRGRAFIRASDERIETNYKIQSDIAVMPGDVIRIPEVTLFGAQ